MAVLYNRFNISFPHGETGALPAGLQRKAQGFRTSILNPKQPSLWCPTFWVFAANRKTRWPDSQNRRPPLWAGRRVLILSHLVCPSVWPWNSLSSPAIVRLRQMTGQDPRGRLRSAATHTLCAFGPPENTGGHMVVRTSRGQRRMPAAGPGIYLRYGGLW